ncbi:hypothetical protein ACX0G9_00090 [Flavitalea flava]
MRETDPVISIEYRLFHGFDSGGNPTYLNGTVKDQKTLESIRDCIDGAIRSKHLYSAVSLGELRMIHKSGRVPSVKLIYDLKAGRYDNLAYIENELFVACIELGTLLDSLRRDNS